jgi:hypothetical protein
MPNYPPLIYEEGVSMAAIAEVVAKSSELQQRENTGNVSKRRQVVTKETPAAMRYFIARENGVASLPQLGKEFSGEKEALIESLRTGLSFFAVSEWKAIPDFSGKNPQILKQTVITKPHS